MTMARSLRGGPHLALRTHPPLASCWRCPWVAPLWVNPLNRDARSPQMPAHREPLSDGRWHMQHGPIDLVIGAGGDDTALRAAHDAAWQRFQTVLDELVGELPTLRQAVNGHNGLSGPVAQRMWSACQPLAPFCGGFITPMAAVAGSVAEEVLASYERPGVARAWVNDGGDIALHLTPGTSLRVGLFADVARFDPAAAARGASLPIDGRFELPAESGVRGIATSGWRGRSFSLGIADSVTVLAASAAEADAAATVIANAVNVNDPRIVRRAANQVTDDSDLGGLLVTLDVPPLAPSQVRAALEAGLRKAHELQAAQLIDSAVLVCQQRFIATAGFDAARVDAPLVPIPAPAPALAGAAMIPTSQSP